MFPGGINQFPAGNSKVTHNMTAKAIPSIDSPKQRIGRASRVRSIAVRFTLTEAEELERASKAAGTSLCEWGRDVLLQASRSRETDPVFTELVATRLLIVNLLKPMLLGKSVPENWIVEAMNGVRAAKHKAAADLRKEYAARDRKES